jgi:hypothetical protein
LIGDSDGLKSRLMAKAPRPPKWSTVKGMRAMWWAFRESMTASAVEAVEFLPWSLERMLAKWVLVISGIDGWDFLERELETWGMVTSIPIVTAAALEGVRRSTEISRGRSLGCSGKRCDGSRWTSC